jgi:hypothetical protein
MDMAWFPVLHTQRGVWHFTVLYANTTRTHALHHTRDWVWYISLRTTPRRDSARSSRKSMVPSLASVWYAAGRQHAACIMLRQRTPRKMEHQHVCQDTSKSQGEEHHDAGRFVYQVVQLRKAPRVR